VKPYIDLKKSEMPFSFELFTSDYVSTVVVVASIIIVDIAITVDCRFYGTLENVFMQKSY
jgi:hypothetical protein